MQPSGLNFQQAPPISVPLRFFLSAPLFALLASIVLLWSGEDLMASRWSPATLAAVHLLTLGYMAMVMAGAMIQMLPVLAGTPVPRPRLFAGIVHVALVLGVLLFAGGLLFESPNILKLAITMLGIGLTVFVVVMLVVLSRTGNWTDTAIAMALALVALGATMVLGLTLAVSRAWGLALPNLSLADLHPAWGLMGWTGLLLEGVAYHIVPMFQMTANYPQWLVRRLSPAILLILLAWSFVKWHGTGAVWQGMGLLFTCMLGGAYCLLAGITLNLQRRRRRRLPDVTLEYWRVGMVSVVLAALVWISQQFSVLNFPQSGVLLGVLAIFGAALSFINGMLCKIVPFLVWFHLQSRSDVKGEVPNVKALLPEKAQRQQLRLHLVALAACAAAALWPTVFSYPAALCIGLASCSVLWNMVGVVGRYRNHANGSKLASRSVGT